MYMVDMRFFSYKKTVATRLRGTPIELFTGSVRNFV